MKPKILLTFICLFVISLGYPQDQTEKAYFSQHKDLGGDVTILKAYNKVDGDNAYRYFEVEAPGSGDYYFNSWMMPSSTAKGVSSYGIVVNDEELSEKITPEESHWQAITLKGKNGNQQKIALKGGVNTIAFVGKIPDVPEVDFIRLSKDAEKAKISDEAYAGFIKDIKEEIKEREKNPIIETDSASLKSAILDNPEGNYTHRIDVPYRYTTYKSTYLTAGSSVHVESQSVGTYMHVLEVFSSSNPETYSWVDLSTSSGNASLDLTITSSGYYYVRVRSYYQNTAGLVDLQIGSNYYNTCPVSGNGFRSYYSTADILSFFTSYVRNDSRIWIEGGSGLPGKIIAWNDDYDGTGDFDWGLASRVKKSFSNAVGATLISAYSSNSPVDTCDLYMGCLNSTVWDARDYYGNRVFPDYKADDAIQSAPQSGTYNCISWSGGITDDWYWPPSPFYGGQYYIYGDTLGSFDNFYGTERYDSAMTYSRSGATSSNSTVDLWALNGSYTHGSVTKPGNNHPHGYDWESKPGGLMRTFHPRNALEGTAYGVVDKYYKITSGLKSAMLLDESIARGLSVIENVELTTNEKKIVSESIDKLSSEQKNNLETKYQSWKETWDNLDIVIHSNPRMYANSEEYSDFIKYCESLGEASWTFVFNKIEQGNVFVINALEDLTLADNMDVLEKVISESSLKSTTSSGATIVRTPQTYAMKYIKELLKSTGEITSTENDGIIYSNSFDFKVYPNPANVSSQIVFNLPYDAKVSVDVIDLMGKVLSVPVNNQLLTQGNYNYLLNIPENFKGICLVKLRINNNVNVQLLTVE